MVRYTKGWQEADEVPGWENKKEILWLITKKDS